MNTGRLVSVVVLTLAAATLTACSGSDTLATAPSAPARAATPPPVTYASLVGTWDGTVTNSDRGVSDVCNISLVIPSQTANQFTGTFQLSGHAGCSEAGTLQGSIAPSPGTSVLMTTRTTFSNGTVCVDSNETQNAVLTGGTLSLQRTFTRSCTSPAAAPFVESQTMTVTRR